LTVESSDGRVLGLKEASARVNLSPGAILLKPTVVFAVCLEGIEGIQISGIPPHGDRAHVAVVRMVTQWVVIRCSAGSRYQELFLRGHRQSV
jgi:hypothetical protein